MTTVIFLLIILASVAFVALPYFRKKAVAPVGMAKKNGQLVDLHTRRDHLLAAIKEIEFDHTMGKISVEDFTDMNARYRHDAIAMLKRIDALNGGNGATQKSSRAQKLEAELRTLRAQQKRDGVCCSACGAAIGAHDRFCSHCGQLVHEMSAGRSRT
ncbi:hypothetical protein KJ068_07220 [bacterium]|nr:hypothetical protein [bacterium]